MFSSRSTEMYLILEYELDASFHISFSTCLLLGSVSSLMAVKGVDSHMTPAPSHGSWRSFFFFEKISSWIFLQKRKTVQGWIA